MGEIKPPKAVGRVALVPLTGAAKVQLEVGERRGSNLVPKVVKLNLAQEKAKVAVLMDMRIAPLRFDGANESMTLVVRRSTSSTSSTSSISSSSSTSSTSSTSSMYW